QPLLAPIVRHHAAADVRAGGMRGEIKLPRIAAERAGIVVNPGYGAAHLLDHGKKAAAGFLDIGKIEDDEMPARAHERFGEAGIVGGAVGAPRPAVHEDMDRRVCVVRAGALAATAALPAAAARTAPRVVLLSCCMVTLPSLIEPNCRR